MGKGEGASRRRSKTGSAGAGARRRKVRYAVVGQGYFAQSAVLPAFENARNSELVALFSDDSTKLRGLKARYGVEHALTYDQYDDFLRSGAVDAVYIALPNDMHCDFTVRAAHAGAHVLCEKPMALTVRECERMIAACRTAAVKLMVAYRLHFEPSNLRAVETIKRGRIGDPRYFTSRFSMQVKPGNVRTERAHGGGPLYDIGIYCINASRYLLRDEPLEVVAAMARPRGDRRFAEVEEQVCAVLRFPGERLAAFTASFGAADQGTYTVGGSKGVLTVDPAYEHAEGLELRLERNGKITKRAFPKRDQVAPELVHFSDCVLRDREPEPSGIEGLIDVAIIEAIHQAAEQGRRVEVNVPRKRRRPSAALAMKRPPHGMPALVNAKSPTAG
jgi:predicted dehydrogenase